METTKRTRLLQALRFGVRYQRAALVSAARSVAVLTKTNLFCAAVIMATTPNSTPPRPMFSERHYKAIAAVLAATDQGYLKVEVISSLLANIFQADNPRFSAPLFMAATRKKIDGASSH